MTPEYTDLIGIPFELSGRGPETYDCYGLVMEMNRRAGVEVPDVTSISDGKSVEALMNKHKSKYWKKTEIVPNATLIFNIKGYGAHVGYVISPSRFIHTWEATGGVLTERLSLWEKRILGAYQYVV